MMQKLMNRKNKKGFTLIELIVVIAIIAILAAIAIPRFGTVTTSAKNKANLSEHKLVVAAVQMYQAEKDGALPLVVGDIDPYLQGGLAALQNSNGTNAVTYATALAPNSVTITSQQWPALTADIVTTITKD